MNRKIESFLNKLNADYAKLHTAYEEYFWLSYMGEHKYSKKMDSAMKARDAFRSDRYLAEKVNEYINDAQGEQKERLNYWKIFFSKYQTPQHLLKVKEKVSKLENRILKERSTRVEGYKDPATKKFIKASELKMNTMIRTHDDEKVRKACHFATEDLAKQHIEDYVQLVKLRNEYARGLGYEDFYDYKIQTEEGMTKKELFKIFNDIYKNTKYAFKEVRKLEKQKPALRKPWNFSYMMAGDFTKEEDPYFQFEDALLRWGKSFAALGIDFRGARLTLDLLDREGKYNNGFCHWPKLVGYKNNKRLPGSSNFTCNVVIGQIGSGVQGLDTLFHEGGHAAHLLNSDQKDVCINHEYSPMSTAWAETQSMFMDSICSSIEWRSRYAINKSGQAYPFGLFKRKVERLHILRPLSFMGILFVTNFERKVYEDKKLTAQKVKKYAYEVYKKYTDRSEESLDVLGVPHIYSWESSASYHGYGLAELAVSQWREYFYKKYRYIVDNPHVGKEMQKVWKLAAGKTFKEFVYLSTRKNISSESFIKNITLSKSEVLNKAKKRIKNMDQVPFFNKPIKLNAVIDMVHGKKIIANNKKSFKDMAETYKNWLKSIK